jgi:hypothetical protein
VKELPHAYVCNLVETSERRFGDDGTEAFLLLNGLKHNGGAHRLTHPKNASGMLLHDQPIEPAMYVVAFL